MNGKYIARLLMILCLALLASACRRQSADSQPTVLPTLTVTPRSTPLPALPTVVPVGQEGNPLRMVVHPLGDISDARQAAPDFEAAVLDQSGLVINVQVADRDAEVLAALCDSSSGQVTVAWLNGLTYAAAQAQNCGTAVLQVERGSRQSARTGDAASIIVNKDAAVTSFSALREKTFCRIGYDDLYSWLIPSLMMRSNGVDPLAINTVNDYEDIPTLVQAVADGDCDAAGIPADGLETFADDIGAAAENIDTLATSINFAFAILVVPAEVPLGTRLALDDTLVALAESSSSAIKMRALLGQNALLPVTPEDFADLNTFIASTGLDFAQLGN